MSLYKLGDIQTLIQTQQVNKKQKKWTSQTKKKATNVYKNVQGNSFNYYLKVFSENTAIRGLVLRDYSNLPDLRKQSPYQFGEHCTQAGLMMLYTNTSTQFPELITSDSTMKILDQLIHQVIEAITQEI